VLSQVSRYLAQPDADGDTLMIDVTHLKAHRTAARFRTKRARARTIGRTKGGLNSRLNMPSDEG
jgi:hypothetical protein